MDVITIFISTQAKIPLIFEAYRDHRCQLEPSAFIFARRLSSSSIKSSARAIPARLTPKSRCNLRADRARTKLAPEKRHKHISFPWGSIILSSTKLIIQSAWTPQAPHSCSRVKLSSSMTVPVCTNDKSYEFIDVYFQCLAWVKIKFFMHFLVYRFGFFGICRWQSNLQHNVEITRHLGR